MGGVAIDKSGMPPGGNPKVCMESDAVLLGAVGGENG